MKHFLAGVLYFISFFTCLAQGSFTISGHIKDTSNGEALIGATVFVQELAKGTASNSYGFYSITLPAGTYHLTYTYVGFGTIQKTVELTQSTQLNMELGLAEKQLQEVVVTSEGADKNVRSMEMSVAKLNIKSIEKLPAFAGEVDIIKSIQLLPGVSTVGEGASGFNIRGGSVGQNMVLLDEAPVYQASHMFGFFSVFNPDAVKDVKLYKGGIPAQYGGRLSSILDIRMKEGNNKNYKITGGIGTIFSRLSVEGPIQKNKSSFIIAARRSYGDVLAKAFTDVLKKGSALYFYDLTAKTNFNLNDKNTIYLSGYFGRDVFRFDKFRGFNWGNSTATFRWNHIHGSQLFSNYSLYYSNYDYGFNLGESEQEKYAWKSRIITYNFKPAYSWFVHANHELTFGGEAVLYQFKPGQTVSVSNGDATDASLDQRKAMETALYVGNEQHINQKLSVQYGIRYSRFSYMGGTVYHYGDTLAGLTKPVRTTTQADEWESISSYGNLEPRASFRYQLTETASIKGSYNRTSQYIHLISNTTAATPIDVWLPSTNNVKPQKGNQVALGYFKNFKENQYETSIEAYYKWNKNQLDYIDGADLFVNQFIESQLLSGISRAYGVEFYAKKNTGRLTGWVSYTLGKAELKVDGINFGTDSKARTGQWYPTRFDQRHNLKIASFYDINTRISVSAIFNFISGTPTTFPSDRITVQGYTIPYIAGSERNNIRIPNYHRLDVSVTFQNIWRGKKGRKGEDNLVVSVYNLYAKKNPFSIYFSQGTTRQAADQPTQTSATQLAMIGTLIPSVSYNFKF